MGAWKASKLFAAQPPPLLRWRLNRCCMLHSRPAFTHAAAVLNLQILAFNIDTLNLRLGGWKASFPLKSRRQGGCGAVLIGWLRGEPSCPCLLLYGITTAPHQLIVPAPHQLIVPATPSHNSWKREKADSLSVAC